MPASRLALVADDLRLASQIQTHLQKAFGREIIHDGVDAMRGRITRDSDGLLLLVAGSPVESERVLRLVQEIYLQKLPPVLMIIEAGAPGPGRGLASLDPHVAGRLRWPEDGARLLTLLRDRLPGLLAKELPLETIRDIIARRLLVQTPSLMPLVERIALAAEHDVTVLLHRRDRHRQDAPRPADARLLAAAKQPFLTVPCGALPANLVESAFFGHVKGAFTGADRSQDRQVRGGRQRHHPARRDRHAAAWNSRPACCASSRPASSSRSAATRRSDCTARIIVASNWDLEEAVQQGQVPPGSVLSAERHVVSSAAAARAGAGHRPAGARHGGAVQHAGSARICSTSAASALDALESLSLAGQHPPAGKRHAAGRPVSAAAPVLLFEHLPHQVREHRARPQRIGPQRHSPTPCCTTAKLTERSVIQRALANNDYSRARAADALGISRVTLYKKMKKYGLMETPLRKGE